MRVLLVDDDAAIARSIELMLKVEEINVYRTDLGEEGVDLGKIYDYDIILLDLNLPDISGYEVLRSLRSAKVVTPVLILSGLASIEDKIRGLGLGADDYLSKPFHKDELIARIHALVRRSKGHARSLIAVGDLIVNLEARNVELHGQKLHLTAKEYQILALLALRIGSTLTKETFLNHLYGGRCQSNDVSSTRSAPRPSASRGLRRESTPLPQCGRASLFVDFPRDEMPLQIEMIVDLSVD